MVYRPGNKTPGRFDDAESEFRGYSDARKVPDVKKKENWENIEKVKLEQRES